MDYNTRLQSNNAELNEIYNALISLPETESDVIRLQYDPGEQIENAQAVYEAFQNGKYILVEGEHTFFSTKTGNTVTATFAIPLISANSDYTFEFKGADSYDNVIYLAYIQVSGWVDVIIERGDPKLQDKATTPNQWTQTIQADFEEYDGLGVVTVYPIPDEYIVPSGTLEIIENGEYDVTDKADVIVSVESAPVAVEEKDVNFYDYDGTLLYSYTLDEIQALTELPPVPDWHAELVPYGWNWTLATLKAEKYPIDVGALYDTNDSKAHMHITIDEFLSTTLSVAMHSELNGTSYIDWGDGSAIESVTTYWSKSTAFTHTYPSHGDYVIKIWGNSLVYLGNDSGQTNIFGDTTTYSPNCTLLRKMFSGTKCGAGRYAFAYCSALEYVTLNPTWGVSYGMFAKSDNLVCCHMATQGNVFGYSVFQACNSLRIVAVSENTSHMQIGMFRDCVSLRRIRPKKDVQINEGYVFYYASVLQEMRGKLNSENASAFQGCNCMRKFVVHENSTGIPASAFDSCFVLQSLDIPASVTSIGAQAFQNCYCMRKIKFNSATPPTVANANAFTNIPKDCIVEVPDLATYQAATNYGTIAAQMVEV